MYTSQKTERKNSQLRSFLENNILIEPSPYLDISSFLFSHRENRGCASVSYSVASLSITSSDRIDYLHLSVPFQQLKRFDTTLSIILFALP